MPGPADRDRPVCLLGGMAVAPGRARARGKLAKYTLFGQLHWDGDLDAMREGRTFYDVTPDEGVRENVAD